MYFGIDKEDFKYEMLKVIKKLVDSSNSLSANNKKDLINEITERFDSNNKWYDETVSGDRFIEAAISYKERKWNQNNFDLYKLWKDVLVANASINNNPQEVADKVIQETIKKFHINEEKHNF